MSIRPLRIPDIPAVFSIIERFAGLDLMLRRSIEELTEHIRDYFVYEEGCAIIGVCGLHIYLHNLAEIKSLAVLPESQGKRIGSGLLRYGLSEARSLGIEEVFALTYRPNFFLKNGFHTIDKSSLPQKIWKDCRVCPKFPNCDEHAVIIGVKDK